MATELHASTHVQAVHGVPRLNDVHPSGLDALKKIAERSVIATLSLPQSNKTHRVQHDGDKKRKDRVTIVTPAWIKRAASFAFHALSHLGGGHVPWQLADCERIIYKSYNASLEDIEVIKGKSQRSAGWDLIRGGWIDEASETYRTILLSSSIWGKVLRHTDGYKIDDTKLILETIHPDPAAAASRFSAPEAQIALQRGTAMEPTIMEMTSIVLERDVRMKHPTARLSILEVGLQIYRDGPYIGVSTDGEVVMTDTENGVIRRGNIEMKCRRLPSDLPYPVIKSEYYDQVQLTQAVLSVPEYTFVCLSASSFAVEHYKFDEAQWKHDLLIVERFYWQRLWVCLILKHMGFLDASSCLPHMSIMSLRRFKDRASSSLSHAHSAALPSDDIIIKAWDVLNTFTKSDDKHDDAALQPPAAKRPAY